MSGKDFTVYTNEFCLNDSCYEDMYSFYNTNSENIILMSFLRNKVNDALWINDKNLFLNVMCYNKLLYVCLFTSANMTRI